MNLNIEYITLMGLEGASMLYLTLQKQRYCWRERTTQDDNDTIGEGITIALVLFLGVISIIILIGMVVDSVARVINRQMVLMDFLRILIVAGLLLAIGLGSLYFFRKKLCTLTKKKNPWKL